MTIKQQMYSVIFILILQPMIQM